MCAARPLFRARCTDVPRRRTATSAHRAPRHSKPAVAYKYNAKKTSQFLAPVGAGSLAPGTPYVSKWPDDHLNVKFRDVLRPALLSRYFAYSPKVRVL